MRRPALAVLSLLLLSPALVTAATPPQSARHASPSTPEASSHSPAPQSWRAVSDAILSRLWRTPVGQQTLRPDAQAADNSPAERLLARHGNHIVLRFHINSPQDAFALRNATDALLLDLWDSNRDWVDIRLPESSLPDLLRILPPSLQSAHETLLQGLELAHAILDTYPSSEESHQNDHFTLAAGRGRGNPFFENYQPLSVINPWMDLMASMFTTHVRRINVGISYEGRDIPALRVGLHPTNNDEPSPPRKTILITGGVHAREWISTSTVNYIAWSLINGYGKSYQNTKILEHFDFVFVPTLNPDGYVYSWEAERLWRKNRQPTSFRFCQGIDLDRTYPFMWQGNTTLTNPCSEAFAGDEPFQGVEAQRFAAWAKNETENNNVDFIGLLDLHSYSQQVLYPYSYSCEDIPPTRETLEELAIGLAKAIRVSRKGHYYTFTSACEGNVAASEDGVLPQLKASGGSALDWFYHELKVRYAFQIKLRDTGSYGFLLPKKDIVPTGSEILQAVLYLGRFVLGEVGVVLEEEPSVQTFKGTAEDVAENAETDKWEDTPFEL